MKAELLKALKDIFKKNTEVNNLYVTADDNIFRAEHYAHNWRTTLSDKTITTVTRAEVMGVKSAPGDEVETDTGNTGDGSNGNNGAGDEKAEAVKRYIELFDTKPIHFMKLETILTKIAEKEAEIAKEAKGNEQGEGNQGEQ